MDELKKVLYALSIKYFFMARDGIRLEEIIL